jgi:hypothetical protein
LSLAISASLCGWGVCVSFGGEAERHLARKQTGSSDLSGVTGCPWRAWTSRACRRRAARGCASGRSCAAERGPLDPLREAVHGLGRAVSHLGLVPRRDLGSPAAHGAAELADLGRAVAVAHVLGELIDPTRARGQGRGGRTARGRPPIRYPACQAVVTSPLGSPTASSPVSLPWACSSSRS